ncbi:MAG: circadian clock protein KaiB [Bacteroidales bacterium]|nr:circadian clock protein KaiB [Bacteroidales bacterium]MCF8404234.1 circadian clock protein KaiB [Bacteroidales bacterium]
MEKYILKLYVSGKTTQSEEAINNLKDICKHNLHNIYDLHVVDVIETPEIAKKDKILATPTLIKSLPSPIRRIIGDLSDKEAVLLGLNLVPVVD